MTDIAIPDRTTAPPAVAVRAEAPSALIQWANEARQASQIATSLANTAFVPQSLRGNTPEITVSNVTAAILAGIEMGMRPMAALRSMDIIYGTPALRAHAMRGLVQSHGHEIELIESTPERCLMRGRRKGAERWQEVVWTLGRARELGLIGKDQWKKQPQTMLIARATGEISRLIAADVLFAMPYTAEELRESTSFDRPAAVQSSPVTLEEIVGAPETAAPASAPVSESGTVQVEAEAAAPEVDDRDEWSQVWSEISVAAQAQGWSKEYTEQQFAELNDGLQVGSADVSDLRAFLVHMTGGAA